ncbi:DUF1906 domain-containing protein [Pseudonocardiaceae bacterium YIM PH 21723]|nr:DUF1906 domain-containing protein [Pseudonocardiaceae bacterium YIM PH 21723]
MRVLRWAAVVLVGGLVLSAAVVREDRQVEYLGYQFTVPDSWEVVELAAEPARCVRLDRHALYLGTPSTEQDCPAKLVGRTEAILVQPGNGPAGRSENEVAREISVDTGRARITAVYNGDRDLVRRVLAQAGLSAIAEAVPVDRTASAAAGPVMTDHSGKGFDTCAAPSTGQMRAWRKHSPYSAVGIYIGGGWRACTQPNLTAAWIRDQAAAGWKFIPIYVGPQAADLTNPDTQGQDAANDAADQAAALGFSAGSLLHYDMEHYEADRRNMVLGFLSGWTRQIHARGFRSGVYSGSDSGVADLAAKNGTGYLLPDAIFAADWDGRDNTAISGLGTEPWSGHRRIKQHAADVREAHGGVTMNIDRDRLDIRFG